VRRTKVKTKSDAESTMSSSLEAATAPRRRATAITPPTVVTKISCGEAEFAEDERHAAKRDLQVFS
jgi:hypothetical protein